ncbi:hypothetical protein A3H65_02450 [Candidatus Giovannonibacteria bacterium RIFCSPLOWO2_02_FULL_45_14]|uniref:Uncharacterized protein n=3 Tax=Parcubacteria group TaxID=1794811 RepID=A0A0H4TGC1_9BACT|nr:hypothetical protein [uncultured Parcubacteria bacterium Rifle_16ft_4_minimus_37658]AKQ05727.1 hypothetical protein [uncultured Parcubacteria bacterium Rifle_16ft_4_minimus_23641]OGF70223.1 MAG: hypothetical protein A3C75_02615 [Candidatus Giovannonibacteria bacterium RIFCSPHIGHO2_02_FULL_44_31]OGF76308.1 MAG: hypothetical protein A3E62_01120 [Candidatus Giovannonibacteria bacterium RIFCSPHIGHO2_12_FULL_44_29]OGF90606.1 MAG: hypothetical protein A3H65_02450 [Candidatus Giovannonibacteria bac
MSKKKSKGKKEEAAKIQKERRSAINWIFAGTKSKSASSSSDPGAIFEGKPVPGSWEPEIALNARPRSIEGMDIS